MKMFFVAMSFVLLSVGNCLGQIAPTDPASSSLGESESKTEMLATVDTDTEHQALETPIGLPQISGDLVTGAAAIKERDIYFINENAINPEDVGVKKEKRRVRGFFKFVNPVYLLFQKGWEMRAVPPRKVMCRMRITHGENSVIVKLPGEIREFDFNLGTPQERDSYVCHLKDGKAKCK